MTLALSVLSLGQQTLALSTPALVGWPSLCRCDAKVHRLSRTLPRHNLHFPKRVLGGRVPDERRSRIADCLLKRGS